MRGFEVAEGELKKPTRPKVGLGVFFIGRRYMFLYLSNHQYDLLEKSDKFYFGEICAMFNSYILNSHLVEQSLFFIYIYILYIYIYIYFIYIYIYIVSSCQ